jgi:acetyl-CoA C-acetyltransferase
VHEPSATPAALTIDELSTKQVDGVRGSLAHSLGGPTAVSAVAMLEGPGGDGV